MWGEPWTTVGFSYNEFVLTRASNNITAKILGSFLPIKSLSKAHSIKLLILNRVWLKYLCNFYFVSCVRFFREILTKIAQKFTFLIPCWFRIINQLSFSFLSWFDVICWPTEKTPWTFTRPATKLLFTLHTIPTLLLYLHGMVSIQSTDLLHLLCLIDKPYWPITNVTFLVWLS